MKTVATCMQCFAVTGQPSFEVFAVDYFDNGTAVIECSAGHRTAIVLQSQKFEMLLESGAMALLEGFTLEACASFAAALERFYEFALRVAFHNRKMPDGLYDKMFAEMARQSERQAGAFMLMYALDFESVYKLKPSIATFRNAVIHKGTIPTVKEAHAFCSDVYEIIYNLSNTFGAKYPDAIQSVVREDLIKRHGHIPNGMLTSTCSSGAFFKLVNSENAPSLDAALDSLSKYRDMIRGLPSGSGGTIEHA
ncbi:hypothetical protein [Methylosinus sp. LW3]|uniref:hypothetical protein n=1 Tax=Methylosinus sp. LW3 TaxID=107635 RepID=UPI0012FB8A05|nr:hypothetical protein [Methylosinus sp. LW3]